MFNQPRRFVWVAVLAILLCFSTLDLLAKKSKKSKGGSSSPPTTETPTTPDTPTTPTTPETTPTPSTSDTTQPSTEPSTPTTVPSVDPVLIQQDQSAIDAAAKVVTSAQQDAEQITDQLQANFQQSQSWIDAKTAFDHAARDLASAQKPISDKLVRDDPDYTAALSSQDQASAALLDMAKQSGNLSPDSLGKLADAVMSAAGRVADLQKQAFDADPPCQAAQQRVEAARQSMTQLLTDFRNTLITNPQCVEAQQKVDDANKTLSDAKAKLTADQSTPVAGATPATPAGN